MRATHHDILGLSPKELIHNCLSPHNLQVSTCLCQVCSCATCLPKLSSRPPTNVPALDATRVHRGAGMPCMAVGMQWHATPRLQDAKTEQHYASYACMTQHSAQSMKRRGKHALAYVVVWKSTRFFHVGPEQAAKLLSLRSCRSHGHRRETRCTRLTTNPTANTKLGNKAVLARDWAHITAVATNLTCHATALCGRRSPAVSSRLTVHTAAVAASIDVADSLLGAAIARHSVRLWPWCICL